MNNVPIPSKSTYRDLGVIVDIDLTFRPHIIKLISSANRFAGCLKRAFISKDPVFHTKMYITFVRSKLEFCTSVWSPENLDLILKLESVQRRFTVGLAGYDNLEYRQRCLGAGLLPLVIRRVYFDLVNIFRLAHGRYRDISLTDFFVSNHNPTRGHRFKLEIQRYQSSTLKHSFSHRTIELWNGLPASLVEANNLNIFKSSLLRDHLDALYDFTTKKSTQLANLL